MNFVKVLSTALFSFVVFSNLSSGAKVNLDATFQPGAQCPIWEQPLCPDEK